MNRKSVLKTCAALCLCVLCLCAFLVSAGAAQKKKVALSSCRVKLSFTQTVYTGKAIKPQVTVAYGDKTLKAGKHYTVGYAGNKEIGVATVKIRAVKDSACSGSKTVNFRILPQKPSKPVLVKATETSLRFRWDAVHGATGYVVYQYDPLKDRYQRWKATKKTALTAEGLTPGKTYLFVVRAYTNTDTVRLYGKPSAWLNAKTKAAAAQQTRAAACRTILESGIFTLAFTADHGVLAGKRVTVWKQGANLAFETRFAGNRLRLLHREDGDFVLMPARLRYASLGRGVFDSALRETGTPALLEDLLQKTNGTPQRSEVRSGKALLQRELYRAEDGTALALDFNGDTLVRVVYYGSEGNVNVTTVETFSSRVATDAFDILPSYQKVEAAL